MGWADLTCLPHGIPGFRSPSAFQKLVVGSTALSNLDACFRHQRLGIVQGQGCSEGPKNRKLYVNPDYDTVRGKGERLDVKDTNRSLGMLSLPPNPSHPFLLPRAILEAPVTEPRFLEQLQELDAKAAAVREQEARGTAACADVRGVLDRLRVKVRAGGIAQRLEPASRYLPRLPLPELMLTSLGSPEDLKKRLFSTLPPPPNTCHFPQCSQQKGGCSFLPCLSPISRP